MTIDVEEHFQVHAFENVIERAAWDEHPSRVVANTRRVLRLLQRHDVHATFFVLGWVADRFPQLVQEIAAAGHEVATHGYWHQLVYRQTPEEFAADLCDSLAAINRALRGGPDTWSAAGYRAPAFSITNESLWALGILRDHGIKYDSSIFPLSIHDRYGIHTASRFASRTDFGVWEIPMSTLCFAGQNWPVAGGGYFRLFPLSVTRYAIRRLNAKGPTRGPQPAVIYLHPWEFDPAQPRIPGAPPLSRFRHYVNLARTANRLETLLREFRFAPIREAFVAHLESV